MTEEQLECWFERSVDSLHRQFLTSAMTQEAYDDEYAALCADYDRRMARILDHQEDDQ